MSWDDLEQMALGLLDLSLLEFEEMTVYQVFVKLYARHDREIAAEVRDRRNAMYMVAPYWSGKTPLKYGWQLWQIPEVDGPQQKTMNYTTVRKATARELELLNKKPEGWQRLLLQEGTQSTGH